MVLPGFRGPYSGMTFRDGVRRITVGPHPHPTNSLLLSVRTPFPRNDAADQGSFSGGQQTEGGGFSHRSPPDDRPTKRRCPVLSITGITHGGWSSTASGGRVYGFFTGYRHGRQPAVETAGDRLSLAADARERWLKPTPSVFSRGGLVLGSERPSGPWQTGTSATPFCGRRGRRPSVFNLQIF